MNEELKLAGALDQKENAEGKRNFHLISALITDMEDHNQEHSSGALWGKSLARGLASTLEDQTFDFETAQRETSNEMSVSTHVNLTELQTRHNDAFKSFGLGLAHAPTENESQSILGKIFLKITDPNRFIVLIKSLGTIERNDQVSHILQTLIKNLESQVYFSAREGTLAEDRDVLDRLGDISTYLSTISADIDSTKINIYRKFNETKRLEEYVAVEQEGLWSKSGENFGPSDWIKDTTTDGLSQKWQKALETLQQQEAKQEHGVAPELREHLLNCITVANSTIDSLNYWSEEIKLQMHEILSTYTQKLRGNSKLN